VRIAFLGKGGAGKTTTSAGFIRYLANKHPFVLAIDADVNAHLKGALHLGKLEGQEYELGEIRNDIIEYLKGERTDLGERPMVGTTPPSLKSRFVKVSPDDTLINKYSQKAGNVYLLTVGTYKEADVGGACYHVKLTGLQSFFHHLLDGPNDLVVADTTAGTDNVATSLSFAYDMNVFVVEPTMKSVKVYLDFLSVAPHLADRTYVIANKVDGEGDAQFIAKHVTADRILGLVPQSKHLKRFEQGKKEALNDFMTEQQPVFEKVFQTWTSKNRDWNGYLTRLKDTHTKVCRDWLDDYFGGVKLDENLDNEFSYKQVIEKSLKELALV
jgi:CO dehydrogenase maturation factor